MPKMPGALWQTGAKGVRIGPIGFSNRGHTKSSLAQLKRLKRSGLAPFISTSSK